jgi:hypothetical protein
VDQDFALNSQFGVLNIPMKFNEDSKSGSKSKSVNPTPRYLAISATIPASRKSQSTNFQNHKR